MPQVLTLIATAPAARLSEEMLELLRRALAEAGARVLSTNWLAPNEACDILLHDLPAERAEAVARAVVKGAAADLGVQPTDNRRKQLLVADMESTVIMEELLDEIGRVIGIGERIAAVTARAMRGEIDFAQSLRERAALLTDLPLEILDRVAAGITLTPGANTLVRTMRANGAHAVLVSGGFEYFARRVERACGFHQSRANRLMIAEGRITGQVEEPILDGLGKLRAMTEAAARFSIPLGGVAAVGDGANDVPMLQAAGLGVAFRGKPAVATASRVRLDHTDLTGVLYLQGYRREDFVE